MKYHIMTATPGAVAILLSVASSVIQVYAAAIPSASSPPPGKFPDDLDIPSTSATPHIQSLPSVSVRNTPPTAVSSSLESTNPMRVNSIILMETRTREYDYLTPRRLDGQKKNSSKNMPLDPSETETEEEGKGKGEDLKGAPSLKKPLKQQKVETDQQRLEREQLLAERQRMKAAILKPQPKLATKKTTPNVTKVPEKKKLNNPLVNPIINNIVYGNGQNGPSFSKPPHPKNQKTPNHKMREPSVNSSCKMGVKIKVKMGIQISEFSRAVGLKEYDRYEELRENAAYENVVPVISTMLRAFVFALVAILVIQANAAVIPNTIPVSHSMLEVRGLGDKLRKFKGKFRQKLNPTSKSKDNDSIRAADTPSRSKASLNEGNETVIPSGAANSTTPRKHRGGQRKMGPQPAFEEEDQSKGKEPALPNSSIFNDTSQITEGSNTTSQTSSSTKHHHHHHPHRHHRTSNATANKHDDDDDDTSTLKPPTRHRGSTVTTSIPPKPDLKRVNSSMSSGSDYAVTLSSEDGNDTRQSAKDPRPERLRVPGHHRTSSSASGRNRDSIDTVTRAGSSASRGPGRGRPRSGSMNKTNDRSSTREREKEKEREREREREKAENRASALYAATQNTQMTQNAQSIAFNANTFATNYGNTAATGPGMTKPPGTR
ncbi:hypothetical protein EV359DRAFT_67767 [Lentinula novae-zelandiae]|nr:hypothetical protein EV359DRAFT_67767 [Lentinula novae-zelandiae]